MPTAKKWQVYLKVLSLDTRIFLKTIILVNLNMRPYKVNFILGIRGNWMKVWQMVPKWSYL